MLLQKLLLLVLALSLPSYHHKCILKSSYLSWLQKPKTFSKIITYRAVNSYLQIFPFKCFRNKAQVYLTYFTIQAEERRARSRAQQSLHPGSCEYSMVKAYGMCPILHLGRLSINMTLSPVVLVMSDSVKKSHSQGIVTTWLSYCIYSKNILETST